MFSVALSVGRPRGLASRVYPWPSQGYAASRPLVFGLSSSPETIRGKRFSALPKSDEKYPQTPKVQAANRAKRLECAIFRRCAGPSTNSTDCGGKHGTRNTPHCPHTPASRLWTSDFRL